MPDLWGLATIATKFALYLGVLTSVGTVLAVLVFSVAGYRWFTLGFAGLGIAATLLGFSLAGASLTGDASGMTDPDMLGLLWSTPVGTAVALRLIGLVLLMIGLFLGRGGAIVSAIGGGLALWSFATIGHIPDRGSLVLNMLLLIHLAAVSLWIGILTPLRALALSGTTVSQAATLGHRFGTLATVFVPVLILAGAYMSFHLVGSLTALLTQPYGQALLVKVVCVGALLALAAANKLRFIPQISAGDTVAATRLATSIACEWGVILAVLGTTAVLTSALTLPS